MSDAAATKPQPPAPPRAPLDFLRNLFSLTHDMAAVQRFSRIRMVHPENVLEHTGMVCVFAYAIARKLQVVGERDLRPLNIGEVLARAVVHDMDETITGDIVRPTKYFSGTLREELHKLEGKGIVNIVGALGLLCFAKDWEDSKKGREGYVVALADFLAALAKVYTEVCVLKNHAMVQPVGPMISLIRTKFSLLGTEWNEAEREFILRLLGQAEFMLANMETNYAGPLPSIHGEV